MNCETCGIPEGTLNNPGYDVTVTRKAENSFRRDRQTAVFCCSRECGIQAMAMSKYGTVTHRWPVTLKQCRGVFGKIIDTLRRKS